MPGTSYKLEKGFIDKLSLGQKDVCYEALKNKTLKGIVDRYRDSKKSVETPSDADVYKAAIIAKITYFDVELLTSTHIKQLLFLLAECLEVHEKEAGVLRHLLKEEYFVLSEWLYLADKVVASELAVKNRGATNSGSVSRRCA